MIRQPAGRALYSVRSVSQAGSRSISIAHGSCHIAESGSFATTSLKACRHHSCRSQPVEGPSIRVHGSRAFSAKVSDAAAHDASGTSNGSQRPSGLRLLDKKRSKKRQVTSEGVFGAHKSAMILGQDASLPIRARFAPSPTGYIHLGSLRTAALNNLAALASNGGSFVLRLEDTDRNRFVPDAEAKLISDLKWAGLKWDEGPDCGGPYGPYRQSERLNIYKEQSQKLLEEGHAYRCFCSQEQLDTQKKSLHEAGQSTAYPKTCRSISSEESTARAAAGEPHMLRLKGDTFGRPKFRDTIYGPYQKGEEEDDFVILKTDGFPTYHLANVVDDHFMKITHVIRGEEWLISTPKHLALYSAFGWQPPTFSHLALLVNPDGSKLSKRQNALGISSMRESGTPPMPLITWLVSQGGSTTMNKTMSDHPRDVAQLAKMMKFEHLKRTPIRTASDQLEAHEVAYIRSLAQQRLDASADELRGSEAVILDAYCRSILDKAQEYQSEDPEAMLDWTDSLWDGPKERLVSLQNIETAGKLGDGAQPLYSLLSLPQISSLDPLELIRLYPYLIWQVPEPLYEDNLARWIRDNGQLLPKEILDVLEKCITDQSCAPSSWLAQIQESGCIKQAGKEGVASMYALLRLFATGSHDLPSPPAKVLFSAISRADWLKRVQTIRKLLSSPQGPRFHQRVV